MLINSIQKKERKTLNYFIVFIVLTLTTDPFFSGSRYSFLFLFLFLGFIAISNGIVFDRRIGYIVLIVSLLIFLQGIFWGFKLLTLVTYISFIILTPYFLFKIMGINVFKYLVNIIYFFSVTSLALWFLQNTSTRFDVYIQEFKEFVFQYSFDRWPRSLIFYTVAISKADLNLVDVYRNAGIFHEPGGYANWLILSIGVNTIITGKPFNRKNNLMSIALLTTFSTAGYVQLFILLSYFVIKARMNLAFKIAVLGLFLYSSFSLYTSVEFMQPKVEEHIKQQSNLELEGTYTTGRIVRVLKYFNAISQSPVIGRGIITASAEEDKYSELYVTGTGSLKIFAHFGIFFGFLFFLYYYRGVKLLIKANKYQKQFALFFLTSLFLGGLSQDFFLDPISIQFFFIGLFVFGDIKIIKKYLHQQNKRKVQLN